MSAFEDFLASQLGREAPPVDVAQRLRRRLRDRAKWLATSTIVGVIVVVASAGLTLTAGFEILREAAPPLDVQADLGGLLWAPIAASAAYLGVVVHEVVCALVGGGVSSRQRHDHH